jgi:hypothetical protein
MELDKEKIKKIVDAKRAVADLNNKKRVKKLLSGIRK